MGKDPSTEKEASEGSGSNEAEDKDPHRRLSSDLYTTAWACLYENKKHTGINIHMYTNTIETKSKPSRGEISEWMCTGSWCQMIAKYGTKLSLEIKYPFRVQCISRTQAG